MNRKKLLMYFDELVSDDALVLYIGKYLCEEKQANVKVYDFFCWDDSVDYFSIVTGLAMTNKKSVYVLFEDYYLFKYFSSFVQASISNSHNLFFILVNSNTYDVSINQPTLFNSVRSLKGVLFNLGVLVHNYTKYFKTKKTVTAFKRDYSRLSGPALGIIELTDNRLFGTPCIDDNFNEFIAQSSKVPEEVSKETKDVLNLDELMKKE